MSAYAYDLPAPGESLASGDESSLKYDRKWHSGPHGGFHSIYDEMEAYPRGPKAHMRSDTRLREDVCECLSTGMRDASDIDVSVQNGEVRLSGTVREPRTKRLAEDVLQHIYGIKAIANQLQIAQA